MTKKTKPKADKATAAPPVKQDEGPPSIVLGGVEATLQLPPSYAECWEVLELGARSTVRALAGAVGVCWPRTVQWPGKGRRPTMASCQYDAGLYAGRVIESLAEAGISRPAVIHAGVISHAWLTDYAYGEQEVSAAEDFTGEGKAPPTD